MEPLRVGGLSQVELEGVAEKAFSRIPDDYVTHGVGGVRISGNSFDRMSDSFSGWRELLDDSFRHLEEEFGEGNLAAFGIHEEAWEQSIGMRDENIEDVDDRFDECDYSGFVPMDQFRKSVAFHNTDSVDYESEHTFLKDGEELQVDSMEEFRDVMRDDEDGNYRIMVPPISGSTVTADNGVEKPVFVASNQEVDLYPTSDLQPYHEVLEDALNTLTSDDYNLDSITISSRGLGAPWHAYKHNTWGSEHTGLDNGISMVINLDNEDETPKPYLSPENSRSEGEAVIKVSYAWNAQEDDAENIVELLDTETEGITVDSRQSDYRMSYEHEEAALGKQIAE
jgi:hypothetical protein